MVYFKSHHGFGIQLFNYVFARCVAERFGYKLQHHSHDGYGAISSGNQFVLPEYFVLDFNAGGRVREGDPVAYTSRHVQKMSDIDASKPILLEGWYERYDQIKDYKRVIASEWLKFKTPNTHEFGPADLAVHVRLGDKVGEQQILDQTYYVDAINAIEFGSLYWFTDSPDSGFMRDLRGKYGGTIVSGSFIEDFKMMLKFKKLVTSTSTYSFWAAWLGEADQIVVPKRGQTCYAGSWVKSYYADCDYWPAEKRYIYLSKPAWQEFYAKTSNFARNNMHRVKNLMGNGACL
jgi:hypothetical protein